MLQGGKKLGCHGLDVRFRQKSMLADQAAKITSRNKLHDDIQVVLPVNMFDVLYDIRLERVRPS
jgi:hypothetical protein